MCSESWHSVFSLMIPLRMRNFQAKSYAASQADPGNTAAMDTPNVTSQAF